MTIMNPKELRSIQEVFEGEFARARNAVVQKLRPDDHNRGAMEEGLSEHWPRLSEDFDLLVLALGDENDTVREMHVGYIRDVQPSELDKKVRIYVDRFRLVGIHDRSNVSDSDFYDTGGGGGARVKVERLQQSPPPIPRSNPTTSPAKDNNIPEGAMEQRLMWVRKNHHLFRDRVWEHWDSVCAVTNQKCNGLLIASHIFPWARSDPKQKTNPNNGLLLCAPLDSLFDRGLISFSDAGNMLFHKNLTKETRAVFGLSGNSHGIVRKNKLNKEMKDFLKMHREFYGL